MEQFVIKLFLGAEIYKMSRVDHLITLFPDRMDHIFESVKKLSRFDESVIDSNSPQDGEMSSNLLAT